MAYSSEDEVLPPLSSEDKMLSGVCYPFWMAVPWFVLFSPKREDPFLTFHAIQALVLGLLGTVVSVLALPLVWAILSSVNTNHTMAAGLLGMFFTFGALIWGGLLFGICIFMGWQASTGRFLRFPGVGEWCEQKMARILQVDAQRLREMAVDRELEVENRITVIQAIPTPEQFSAEMDRWATAQPVAQQPLVPPPPVEPAAEPVLPSPFAPRQRPAAELSRPRTHEPRPADLTRPRPGEPRPETIKPQTEAEIRPWRPAAAEPAREPEVKPWRPATTPQAKPVNFPAVSRPSQEQRAEEKGKWWKPKD
jgi:uncharacterized membrane protein